MDKKEIFKREHITSILIVYVDEILLIEKNEMIMDVKREITCIY